MLLSMFLDILRTTVTQWWMYVSGFILTHYIIATEHQTLITDQLRCLVVASYTWNRSDWYVCGVGFHKIIRMIPCENFNAKLPYKMPTCLQYRHDAKGLRSRMVVYYNLRNHIFSIMSCERRYNQAYSVMGKVMHCILQQIIKTWKKRCGSRLVCTTPTPSVQLEHCRLNQWSALASVMTSFIESFTTWN